VDIAVMSEEERSNVSSHDEGNHDGDNHDRDNHGSAVVERARPKLAKPPLFKVVLINDDYTPMEFVVEVLQVFFNLDWEQAHVIMLHVHQKGKGVCGVYTREIAETKVALVNQYSREGKHPLMCEMEEA